MANILIPTIPDDTHALFVHLALREIGHKSLLWYTADFPIQQTHSIEIKNNNIIWNSDGTNFKTDNETFDIVWNRRPRAPILPNFLHPDDLENANKENVTFYQNLWHAIAPDAFWINKYENSRRANCKSLQLKIASEVGLNIAPTIISNDPNRIKAFIASYKKGEVIYKTLHQITWLSQKEIRIVYTKEITLDDLPPDLILQSTVGIFQKKIPKAFELRVNYMGNKVITVKLNSQHHPKAIDDWRSAPTLELSIEKFKLPESIDKRCRKFMKKMGIVFGCFDFIVTPDNEYYFLEINEQGQFLWIEEVNPDIKMLDAFVNFLISKDKLNPVKKFLPPLSCSDFATEVNNLRLQALELHTNPDSFIVKLKN